MDAIVLAQLERRIRRINLYLFFLFLLASPLIILFLVFGLPVVGTYTMLALADHLNCTVNVSAPQPCYLFGADISGIVGAYAYGSVLGGALNPFFFVVVVTKFIPTMLLFYAAQIWTMLAVSLIVIKVMTRKRITEASCSSKRKPLRGSA